MEIALLSLKITGMILGAVLGILIAVTALVLYAPIRYRGEGFAFDRERNGEKEFGAELFASWLLRLVRVYISAEKAFRVRVKVLFFTLYDTGGEDKPQREKKEKHKKHKKDKKKKSAESSVETKAEQIKTAVPEVSAEVPEIKESGGWAERKEQPDKQEESKKEPDFEDEYPPKKQKKEKKQTIQNFCGKLKGIKEKIAKLKELWEADYVVRARGITGRQLKYLLKHTKPRKLEGYLRFGFDDPSVTGYTMAAYGILYPFWNPKLSVEPDFEKQLLDCRVHIKGKVRVWHLLRVTSALFFSQDVRRAIKDIRSEL